MPELPDVDIFREYFQATALHQTVDKVEIFSPGLLEGISAARLKRKLAGRVFLSADRHGKYLFAGTDKGQWLVLHFGMTGFLKSFKKETQAPEYLKLLLTFGNGYRLGYDCRRKLGRIGWTADRERFVTDKGLGQDALPPEFTEGDFLSLVDGRRGTIKGLLMNQRALAGIGNVYSDEILFQADIDPERAVPDLPDKERRRIYACLDEVLHTAIDRRVGKKGWPEDWLLPRREPGGACPHCGGKIIRLEISGRGSYCCRKHQR